MVPPTLCEYVMAALLLECRLGLLDCREFLFRRAGHQMVSTVDREIGDEDPVDDRGADHHPRIDGSPR